MTSYVQQKSNAARQAAQQGNWTEVKACARDILNRDRNSAEAYFLLGLAEGAANRREQAIKAQLRAIELDGHRPDAALELAGQYMRGNECGKAVKVVEGIERQIMDGPRYLNIAAQIYTDAGQPEKGWPLFQRANELQPGVHVLQANFAACSVYVGKIDEAIAMYRAMLKEVPDHQRHHYELSRLRTAKDSSHIDEMLAILEDKKLSPAKNIYLYYALGKEYEDLERWDEAFDYYKMAGDAAASVSKYDVTADIELIDRVIRVCDRNWFEKGSAAAGDSTRTPVFVVGLPRTGTTLTERILSSHSQIESVGESYYIQTGVRQLSGIRSGESMSPTIIAEAANKDVSRLAKFYRDAIEYKFGDKPMFIEKFPENFLYLGFIAKAFPEARIVHVNRNPMDTCFAMYKQSFFRYAYSLDDLGPYYVAYRRLLAHWRELLGERLIEVDYEALVTDQETTTRRLLDAVGVEFEKACLSFEKNEKASNTASTVQIREKVHTRSIGRWKRFERQLESLVKYLDSAGIVTH